MSSTHIPMEDKSLTNEQMYEYITTNHTNLPPADQLKFAKMLMSLLPKDGIDISKSPPKFRILKSNTGIILQVYVFIRKCLTDSTSKILKSSYTSI